MAGTVGHIVVGRNQWAYTTSASDAPMLETNQVFHDHIVTVRKSPWAIMARVGADTDIGSMDGILERIRTENGDSLSGVEVVVLGGDAYSETDHRVFTLLADKLKSMQPKQADPHGHDDDTLDEYFYPSDDEELSTAFRSIASRIAVDTRDSKIYQQGVTRDLFIKDGGRAKKDAGIPLEQVTEVSYHAEVPRCQMQ